MPIAGDGYPLPMSQSRRKRSQHHFAKDSEWAQLWKHSIASAIGEPSRPDISVPLISMLSMSPTGTQVELEFRFRASERYCCAYPYCYISPNCGQWWQRIRESLRESSDRDPPPLSITVLSVVEEGALLEEAGMFGGLETVRASSDIYGPWHEADAKHF